MVATKPSFPDSVYVPAVLHGSLLMLPATAIFFLELGVLHAIQKWEKKVCNLPLILLVGAQNNMLWETIHSLPILSIDTSCPVYKQFHFSNLLHLLCFRNILDTEKILNCAEE